MKEKSVGTFLKKYTMIIVLVIVALFFTWQTQGRLIYPQNINNLISQNAYVFILATGMLLCILTGGNIDLSVGSVVCFVGAVGATLMVKKGMNMILCIIIMLAVGLAIGIWQGFWIAYRRIPPFIVTLAGMLMFRGLSNIVLQGYTVAPMPQNYLNLFNSYIIDFFHGENFNITSLVVGIVAAVIFVLLQFRQRMQRVKKGYEVGSITNDIIKCALISLVMIVLMWRLGMYKGIPNILLWILVIVIIYGYVTSKTTIGRHFYAVGGNEKAAKLSGINTNRVYFIAYANMGLLAAVAAMVTIARLNSANPTAGDSYEMDAIGSCFIGGASAYGGSGTIPGVIVGATLMGVINLGMSIMGIDANWQKVVKGLVLLGAVIFDVESKKNSR
ncbi:putative multiple sugar transport system permease protein [Aequitasia blattaphilus]|uniref:Xylose transport system permease protein XylH n=1 Tax=Aequitasia blattaphilus TaxID=2949332 RepID=A0ABT1EDB8_9FIRM|nr:multiple monosaccharide ABC transporter permease [Aequitasia blattaphilus]MCP1102846.1 sugar ABC transporter permease [Aequitasia blattaphilus]MCR8615486.1 sugar ABC transporter permease [Aequitasia blattaphilus]